jgi:hypothetical protein
MTLGERIELAIYRFVEIVGKGQPRSWTTMSLARDQGNEAQVHRLTAND